MDQLKQIINDKRIPLITKVQKAESFYNTLKKQQDINESQESLMNDIIYAFNAQLEENEQDNYYFDELNNDLVGQERITHLLKHFKRVLDNTRKHINDKRKSCTIL
jgi:hypothetical protein